jgi:hypothetical protein
MVSVTMPRDSSNLDGPRLSGLMPRAFSSDTPSNPATSAGLIIKLIADDSVASAPVGFADAMRTAADMLETVFSDNVVTINPRYGWGSYNSVANPEPKLPPGGCA